MRPKAISILRSPDPLSGGEPPLRVVDLLRTPQLITDYAGLLALLPVWAHRPQPTAVEFCNTQIISKRRGDRAFAETTRDFDYFVPDGMPLIWCLRAMGVPMPDRIYGPSFMHYALTHETSLTHYFLGGSAATSQKLVECAREQSGGKFRLVGANHRYWGPEDSPPILEEINRLSPDVIWIGLGTPKQQEWVRANKHLIARGVLLTVGFAFDVNAGTKRDAPDWVQRLGLTWLFRISQEPSRLLGRYAIYNTWFVWFCGQDLAIYVANSVRKRISAVFSRKSL